MKFHISREGTWKRCRAVVQPGRGVLACPLGDHADGLTGIAESGGGVVERSDGEDGTRLADVTEMTETGYVVTSRRSGRRAHYGPGGRRISWQARNAGTSSKGKQPRQSRGDQQRSDQQTRSSSGASDSQTLAEMLEDFLKPIAPLLPMTYPELFELFGLDEDFFLALFSPVEAVAEKVFGHNAP